MYLQRPLITLVFLANLAAVFAQDSISDLTFSLSHFTERERTVVATPTVGLFEGRNKFVIDLTRLDDKDWCYPLREGKVISPFGRSRRHHTGADIKTHAGDTIYAAFSGRVRMAQVFFGYGNLITVRHDMGFETIYSHNRKNLVKAGEWVKAGQAIAIEGRTGRATTEHCHFEIRINGNAVDPLLFFDMTERQLRHRKIIAWKNGKTEAVNVPESSEQDKPGVK